MAWLTATLFSKAHGLDPGSRLGAQPGQQLLVEVAQLHGGAEAEVPMAPQSLPLSVLHGVVW
jgi:hypothetical protein